MGADINKTRKAITNNDAAEPKKKKQHDIISSRLSRFMEKNNLTQENVAEILGVSATTINRWLNDKKSTPPVYHLPAVAKMLGLTVDALLSGNEVMIDQTISSTYSKSFLAIVELSDHYLIGPFSCDPFLSWLLSKKAGIDRIAKRRKGKQDEWMNRVLSDFDKPLISPYLTQYIELFKYEYEDFDEYSTYIAVLNLFEEYGQDEQKTAEIDELIQRWNKSIEEKTHEFPQLQVPWGGFMYGIDENGNVYQKELPDSIDETSNLLPNDPTFI